MRILSCRHRKALLPITLVVGLTLFALMSRAASAAPPLPFGAVMVSTGNGLVSVFSPPGVLLGQLHTGNGSGAFTTGSAFDTLFNFYVTDFYVNSVSEFDPSGSLLGSFGSGYNADDESILFDAIGNAYVGQADGSHQVLKFDPTGAPLASFSPATEVRGTDWIALAGDQCTLYYTSEGKHVKRYNVCTSTQLADLNSVALPGSAAYAVKILPTGNVLVADSDAVRQLNPSGTVVKTYSCSGSNGNIFALTLDPDTVSFWTGDIGGQVCEINIASGAIEQSWNAATVLAANSSTNNFLALGGITVKGEVLVARSNVVLSPDIATDLTGGNHTVTATLTSQPFCHGGTNPVFVPVVCSTLANCPDHTTAGTACNLSGYRVFFAVPGTCTGGTNDGSACTDNTACAGGGTCNNSNSSPNFGTTGSTTTNASGVATFTYHDANGSGADTISSCANTDIFTAVDHDDPDYAACVNGEDDTVSNTALKYWASVNLTPVTAFDLVGGNHTVTANVSAASFCHGGTNPTSPPQVCNTLADCSDQSTGTSCDESGYDVFFAIPGVCSVSLTTCVTNADCTGGADVCTDALNSPNFGTTQEVQTNAAGVATFTYPDTGGVGIDFIKACADTDLVEAPDESTFASCVTTHEDTTSQFVEKFWLANYVTGGGKVSGSGGSFWTFGGNVGPNPSGIGISGDWQLVYHPSKGAALACHWDNFSFLYFSGPPITSPASTHNTAFFEAVNGSCTDGSSPTIAVTEVDNHDGGKGADTLKVLGPSPLLITPAQKLTSGNVQMHDTQP